MKVGADVTLQEYSTRDTRPFSSAQGHRVPRTWAPRVKMPGMPGSCRGSSSSAGGRLRRTTARRQEILAWWEAGTWPWMCALCAPLRFQRREPALSADREGDAGRPRGNRGIEGRRRPFSYPRQPGEDRRLRRPRHRGRVRPHGPRGNPTLPAAEGPSPRRDPISSSTAMRSSLLSDRRAR